MSSDLHRRQPRSWTTRSRVESSPPIAAWTACLFALATSCADFERGERALASEPPAAADDAGLPGAAGSSNSGSGVSFSEEIHPLLLLECQPCHAEGGSASDTAFLLSGDLDTDYQTTLAFVDVGAPAQSRLLSKARGTGHQPGAIFPEPSDEHQLVARWISEGALP